MSTPPDTSRTRIGDRYLLEERIGAGAMGAVWRGTDELLNRVVAVKELLAVVPTDHGEGLEEARQRLLREGRIGARLQHPHVISMFDVVLHDERPWLVMEYLPSRSLATVITEGGPLQPRDVADIGRQVADGLAAAHAAGVVHRDVKPGNVLLGDDGRVKLTDFGVSRAVDDVQVTRTGLIAGTPAFLAPEVARGREPTPAADVFALGATIYTAVEGRPPFGLDDNAFALLHKVATGEVDPPRQAGPLTAVLMRLLAPEPEDRPDTVQARDLLAAVAAGATPALVPPTATAVLDVRRPFRRRSAPPGARAAPPPPTRTAAAPEPRPSRPTRAGGRRRVAPLLVVLLAVLLLSGGVAAALVASRSGSDVPPAAGSDPTSQARPGAAAPSSAAPVPPSDDPVGFVQAYYALLPRDTDAAWARLSDQAQAASGGRATFEGFYAGIESVGLQEARDVGDGTVEAFVVFDPVNGDTSRERYQFVVGDEDGEPILRSFRKL